MNRRQTRPVRKLKTISENRALLSHKKEIQESHKRSDEGTHVDGQHEGRVEPNVMESSSEPVEIVQNDHCCFPIWEAIRAIWNAIWSH
uniref:Uncharacterized protein n=1 Tax=Medicago truncatula TaxID=3880 RepID=Q2HRZ2_MEDTR|nr:hypothetical protein MtrDRAFT_AC157777g10v2 [Medicago truncatula]